jgi:hypothetical protein
MIPLDPHFRYLLDATIEQYPAVDRRIKTNLQLMGFWPGILWMSARMLVHPGKAKEKPQGKTSFPPGVFLAFCGPEAFYLSCLPATGGRCLSFQFF